MLAITVNSTTLSTVAYDAAAQLLQLVFRNGAAYCYFGVPSDVYQDLMSADSMGAYFTRNIRPRFPYQKLPEGALHS